MLIRYRTFDDVEFKEIECTDFTFRYDSTIDDKPSLFIHYIDNFNDHYYFTFENICEVYIEQL